MTDTNTAAPDPGLVKIGANTVPLALAQRAVQRFANWFWWLAALSLINSLAAGMNLGYRMILGLGMTQYLDALFPFGETAQLWRGLSILRAIRERPDAGIGGPTAV
jgi:hypothetical protein